MACAVAGGGPMSLRDGKTVGELGLRLSVHRTRTVARAAKREARLGKDGSSWRIIVGIDVSKDRLDVAVRPSGEAFVVERETPWPGRAGGSAARTVARSGRLGSHRRVRDRGGGSLGRGRLAGGHRQPGAGPGFRQGAGKARQDRSDRRRGHCSFCRGHQCDAAASCRRGHAVACRSRHPPPADRRDDRGRAAARATADRAASQEEHRSIAQGAGERVGKP